MKLTIIIVSYNVRDYLGQCLRSIDRAMSGLDVEVIVVDNCSKDGTVDGLSKEFPWVRLIKSNRNLGFAKANNQAIRTSKSEYVLLLNPDTIIGEDVLRYALQFMDTNPKAGGAGVRMLRRDGYDALESRRGVPTPMTAFYKMVGLCARFPYSRRFGRYYMGYLS
ncbi:MAG: glycosyltransferase family 2 protein, partial [Massilibacteroides sp.]|nr:glycosyltransferase family 2 protein [Massilibacteroides sp.]